MKKFLKRYVTTLIYIGIILEGVNAYFWFQPGNSDLMLTLHAILLVVILAVIWKIAMIADNFKDSEYE